MGILALVDYHLIEEICEKLKHSKGSFSGRLREENETTLQEGSALEALKTELIKAKNKSRKRKREKKRKQSPVRFRQNNCSPNNSSTESSTSSSFGESSNESSNESSEPTSDGPPKNKFARKSSAQRINESTEESNSE